MSSLEVDIATFSDADFNLTQTQPFANGLATVGSNALHMQIRRAVNDPQVFIELTTVNGLLTIGGGGTTITIRIPQSSLLNLPPGQYFYSVIMSILTQFGVYTRTEVFRGIITHSAGPTQWTTGTL